MIHKHNIIFRIIARFSSLDKKNKFLCKDGMFTSNLKKIELCVKNPLQCREYCMDNKSGSTLITKHCIDWFKYQRLWGQM